LEFYKKDDRILAGRIINEVSIMAGARQWWVQSENLKCANNERLSL